MLMETEKGQIPPPPRLVASLTRGFDTVANHVLVIMPPMLLDLFLWFGPHLHLKNFLQPIIDGIPSLANTLPANFPDVAAAQQAWLSFANQFNLFIILRTFPVGATSLLSFQTPGQSPLGVPPALDAGSFFSILGWVFVLVLAGWLFGALYYYWISAVALKHEVRSFWRTAKQTVLLSCIWLGLLFMFGTPAFFLLMLIVYFSPLVGQIALFMVALLLIWLIMPVFFSAHGIFVLQMDALRAILNSLRMVRFTLPNTGLFLLAFVLINQGLNFLWSTPPSNSWLLLVGIAGHAFISTALLAASFIYYRDINAWLTVVLERLQQQANSAKV